MCRRGGSIKASDEHNPPDEARALGLSSPQTSCGDRVIARAARDRGAQKASTGPAHAPMQPWVTQPMAAKKTAETKRRRASLTVA